MKSNRVNIKNLVASSLFGPKVDGAPLFKRSSIQGDKYRDSMYNGKSDKWLEKVEKVYSSPDNIKTVWFTGTRIVYDLYTSVVGNESRGLLRDIAYKNDDMSIKDCIVEDIQFQQNKNRVAISNKLGENAENTTYYDLHGNAIEALSNPWVCSNIEEIYFDEYGIGSLQFFNYILTQHNISGSELLNVLMYLNNTSFEQVRKQFPRLRVIGYINNLDDILNREYVHLEYAMDYTDKGAMYWFENDSNSKLIKEYSKKCVIYKCDKDIGRFNDKFSVKDGIYAFDDEKLSNIAKAYGSKMNELKQKACGSENKENSIKSAIECLCDAIIEKDGEQRFEVWVVLFKSSISKKEVDEAYRDMSDSGKKKYGKYFKQ